MNIFGIGTAELGIILLLMLIVAGPKRMVQWAYVAGQYLARFREIWQQTVGLVRKELEQAGLEPEVMDSLQQFANPRTRARYNPLDKLVDEMKKPVDEAMKPVADTAKEVKAAVTPTANPNTNTPETRAASMENAEEPASSDTTPERQSDMPQTYDAWTPK